MALLLLTAVPSAAADVATLFVTVSFKAPDQLSVKSLDPYGSPIEEADMEVTVTPEGGKAGPAIKLKEGPAGTYTARLDARGAKAVSATIETIQLGDLFRAKIDLDPAKDLPEEQIQMEQILLTTKGGFTWNKAIFVIEGVLFVVAVVAGLFWRPKPKPQ